TIAGALETYDAPGDFFRLGVLNPGNAVAVNLTFPTGGTLNAANSSIALFKEGVAAPVATANAALLNSTILEDGVYYLRLLNSTPDLRSQYVMNLSIVDGVAPLVQSSTLPAEGSSVSDVIDRFNVDFSEELLASTATNAANFELRSAGAD